jgi:hypothetical protein
VFAADLTGIWVGQIPGRNGEPQDIAFKFTQNGITLGGKLYGDYQSAPISEGKISGDRVTFVVIAPEQAGNQINKAKLRFSGSITTQASARGNENPQPQASARGNPEPPSGEMELTREREGATNAGDGGTVQFRGNAKQTFRLKRLL